MSAEQSLVGAMGCASWCAHDRLGEHAALAPAGSVMREAGGVPVFGQATALGLNEVGVTDLVMMTLWRCGPRAAAYAVSAGAETHHVGADIAILHPGPKNRITHYQAKLAWLDGSVFRLKSTVTKAQVEKLNRRTVDIQGDTYDVTGRLALYQADTAPFLRGRPACCGFGAPWGAWWWSGRGAEATAEPTLGRDYYKTALVRCRCSPSGIVAAPVPPRGQAVAVVPEATTWPWEFDIYEWFRGVSPLDNGDSDSPTEQAPRFDEYEATGGQAPNPDQAAEIATQLAEQLRLPMSQRLHLIILS